MHRRLSTIMVAVAAGAVLPAWDASPQGDYERAIEDWRAERLGNLRNDSGYLNLVGLFPLTHEAHRFGFSGQDEMRLEPVHGLPEGQSLGTFMLSGGGYRFVSSGSVTVTFEGEPVQSIAMVNDAAGAPTVLAAGPLRWFVVARGGEELVRVRDLEAPRISAFGGFEYFPIDRGYRIEARFEPADTVRELRLDNVIGTYEAYPFVGHVVFSLDGAEHRLTAVESGGRLFLVFGDATNGSETYGGGRFLYADFPAEGSVTTLDFNLAYNPPCAISAYTTCPLPPPENRLPIRVEAGEKAPLEHR